MSVVQTIDIATCQLIRKIVFTDEQGVSTEDEVDGMDESSFHFLSYVEGKPVGTARVSTKDGSAKIGRVCVLKEVRGTYQGQALIQACLDWARAENHPRAVLGAQLDALGFYEGFGFKAYGEVFNDAGIDHRMMELSL
jgi:predicted GNAT family N-acyltransferase